MGGRARRRPPAPTSARLEYRLLGDGADDPQLFWTLAVDEHIRQYLLDGAAVDRAWAAAEVRRARALHARRGVGLWLIYRKPGADGRGPIGFCGFRVFEELGDEPQVLYALLPAHTGCGYATEAARAMIEHATTHAAMTAIPAAVDEPNRASIRVLEKLGFRAVGDAPGAFGRTLLFRFG